MKEIYYGEYGRTIKEIWYKPPIGGADSILKKLDEDLSKTKILIEKLQRDIENHPNEELKNQKQEFIEKIKLYNLILEKLLSDLKNYSNNIFKLLSKIDSRYTYYQEIVSCSNYLEPLLISISPIFFKAKHLIQYELNEDLSNNQNYGEAKVYESFFVYNGGKFYTKALLRSKGFNNLTSGRKGEARVSFKVGDYYNKEEPILSARIDLEKNPDSHKYSVGFDFEFPNSSYIHKYVPQLSEKIVNKTLNTHTHHSFLTNITPGEFEGFVNLCNSIISEE